MKKVLVTGISGFVGQHCAAELLKKGYAVKGSVRNLAKKDKVIKGISKVVDPKDNLEFCELNLSDDAGWDEAMEGCEYVLHVASPFVNKQPKNEDELIKPAVEGTLRAMHAAKKAHVKRVVLTSSLVAMLGDATVTVALTPDSWTNVEAEGVTAYLKSKTLAEKSAWSFIRHQEGAHKLELVVVNPGPIYGPTLSGNLKGESMSMFKQLITGKMPLLPKFAINMSDVRDVAEIHVLALENEAANGKRFLVCTPKAHSLQELARILEFGGYTKVSTRLAPNCLLRFMAKFSSDTKGLLPYIGHTFNGDISETMTTFDWKPITLKRTVMDTAKSVENAMRKRVSL